MQVTMKSVSVPQEAVPEEATGLSFHRHYTTAALSPYDMVEWERRQALITDAQKAIIFQQHDVEVPKAWSQTATNIVASKYFHGAVGTPDRETSVRQLVHRVCDTIRAWGREGGYFHTREDADIFYDELAYLIIHQMASFNSPVWFNVGCDRIEPSSVAQSWHWNRETGQVEFARTGYRHPQCSACFINSVDDTLDSILSLAKTEGMLFKWGSGTGTNLSAIRGSMEQLSGGGTASGPLSFMKGLDTFAGVIKSGGKTRRAAKMAILNIDHPDIEDFIECKAREEAKAWALAEAGYDASGPDSEAYSSIFFQNANNSVRVTDEFLKAVETDGEFATLAVRDGRPVRSYKARNLLRKVAEAAWKCGDPGIQFDTAINRWHTSSNTGRINASNPCSEYMFLDDSACNLASLNLLKFLGEDKVFDDVGFRHAVDVMITAQEILIDVSGYPTESIARNSHDYRPLGLGYANLGALLMSLGVPYDSDAGRHYAAGITALMCGEAYKQSASIAKSCAGILPTTDLLRAQQIPTFGACPGSYYNREPFLNVIRMHRDALDSLETPLDTDSISLRLVCQTVWDQALALGERCGYRNSQVTVLAPTGTISFMMDCDTTGVEPDLALVKFKKLVGGGVIKITNNSVTSALASLGYSPEDTHAILAHIEETGTIEGAHGLRTEHLPVFDCSFQPTRGTRSIHYMGHLRMMAAVQPFLSGAISKTVNLPESATADNIMQTYLEAWRLGLKSVAVYRDGCKKAQPLSAAGSKTALSKNEGVTTSNVSAASEMGPIEHEEAQGPPRAVRHYLPRERDSKTHKYDIAGHEGYITVGLYPSGQPGEIFVKMAKGGSTMAGLMDCFAVAISMCLQYGVPIEVLCAKFSHTRFEPSGWTGIPEIPFAKSIMDYIFQWLELRFVSGHQGKLFSDLPGPQGTPTVGSGSRRLTEVGDSPTCRECGSIMNRTGPCYRCLNCGSSDGACG
jgi:ribonucleoside-diphosphate reductase alpha chain